MQFNANWLCMQIVTGDRICPNSSYSFVKSVASLRQGFYNQGTSWYSSLDELKNFAANIFLKLVSSSYTRICVECICVEFLFSQP